MEENGAGETIDIEALLQRMAPPRVPDMAFGGDNPDLTILQSWKRNYVTPILAALSTDPALHANGIRIDWLQRLVLSKSAGRRKPTSAELAGVLNSGLGKAGVLRLEDPNEDAFCSLIASSRGNFRIFTGQWETAGPYTQTLLDAFELLPPSDLKRDALTSVYALLKLSDALAERSHVDVQTPSAGTPMGPMALPRSEALVRLGRRVRFDDADLATLGIEKESLAPFYLEPAHYPYISDREPGDTPLEFYPLILLPGGVVIASTTNISVAVRAVLVRAAQSGGMADALLQRLMEVQEHYSETSLFWPVSRLQLSGRNRFTMRASVVQFEEGRFLHVIQVPATFDGFPRLGFASVRSLGAEANAFIGQDVSRFWSLLNAQADYRQGVTVLLLSGWGTPHGVSPAIDESLRPPGWQYLALSFADAAVLGACENGKFRDICRLLNQVDRLEAIGVEIHNVNGILNLFGHWRATDGNLIPENMREMMPPCNIMIPTDGLLVPRTEAVRNRDPRALPLQSGGYKRVQRMNWDEGADSPPIYASEEDAVAGRLMGAVLLSGRTWWLTCEPERLEAREWSYRVWNALLQWLSTIGQALIELYPQAFPEGAFEARLIVSENVSFTKMDRAKFTGQALEDAVAGTAAADGAPSVLTISSVWVEHLWTAENDAEVELTAGILELIAVQSATLKRAEIRSAIRAAIGSSDWRWLHAQPVVTPLDELKATGLVPAFHAPSWSASAETRCCSIWSFRNPADGTDIEGEEDCEEFLTRYRDYFLETLLARVREFNRERLVIAAANAYQAGRLEQQNWRGTIRALRAIHGSDADLRAFKRQNEINAVQRAAKSICEVAACEAAPSEGLAPGRTDLEELFALALQLLGNGQLFASVRAGLLKPSLRISPAGDLLSDRAIFETTLRPGAEWLNAQALHQAAEAYRKLRSPATPEASARPWEPELKTAIEAEYEVSSEAFASLQFELVKLAESRRASTFILRRSDLRAALSPILNADPSAFLRRLTLAKRKAWGDRSSGLSEGDIDLGRFDRPYSLINRPLLALDDDDDPRVLVAPLLVSDATMYSLSGLIEGSLHGKYWASAEARAFAGARAAASGEEFEDLVAQRLRDLGLSAWPRCKLGWVLNQKVDAALGDIDVLAVSPDKHRVWIIEAKNLKLCRTETEIAARLSEYRGRMIPDGTRSAKPDKLLRHLHRVEYLRARNAALCGRLKLDEPPEVRGLLIVDSPQPMNFYMLEEIADAQSIYLDKVDQFAF